MSNKLEDLRFKMTQEMENTFIEMIIIRQMLKESKLKKEERQLLEKELKELSALFVLEFRENNKEQRKIYNDIMNS